MAIAVYFHPKNMTLPQFEEAHRRLADAGAAEPDGRIHHSCFGEDGGLMVYDIWESPEAFEAFGGVPVVIWPRPWGFGFGFFPFFPLMILFWLFVLRGLFWRGAWHRRGCRYDAPPDDRSRCGRGDRLDLPPYDR